MADAIDRFFGAYDREIETTARSARDLVRRLVPSAAEKLHLGWKTVAYSHEKSFCAISPHKSWVNLQFHRGDLLEDPDGLLAGTGKAMRHVKVSSPREVGSKQLAKLIREAAHQAE